MAGRVELAARWAEERGITSNRHGRVYPVIDRLETWSKRLSDELAKLDAEARERRQAYDPDAEMARIMAEVQAESEREE